jgi:hypothetical protein
MLNMKVGGPYKVMITFIDFTQEINDVFLELGKPFNLDILLQDESQQLSEVVITGSKTKFLVGTGAETTIGRKN